jgi:hypothetical protein
MIVLRSIKGSPLTEAELDGNFTHLEDNKLNKSLLATNNAVFVKDNAGTLAEVAVDASEFLGRKATGGIVSLTVAEVKTILDMQIADIPGLQDALDDLDTVMDALEVQADDIDDDITALASTYEYRGTQAAKITNYTVTSGNDVNLPATDVVALIDNSGDFAQSVYLPTIASCWDAANGISKVIILKLKTGTTDLTLRPHTGDGAANIDGSATKVMANPLGSYAAFTDGTDWWTRDQL